MEARGKHPVCRRRRYSRLSGKRRPDCREGRRPSTNTGAICSGSSRAIWTTRIRPLATIWFWPIEARGGCCARRVGLAPNSWPPDTICRSEWAHTAASGNSIRSRGRAAPGNFRHRCCRCPYRTARQTRDILLSQQFVDDAQRYGYRFEEEGPSLVDDQYVGAQRYQAGAGVLISKDSEAAQHVPIYLFGSAAKRGPKPLASRSLGGKGVESKSCEGGVRWKKLGGGGMGDGGGGRWRGWEGGRGSGAEGRVLR